MLLVVVVAVVGVVVVFGGAGGEEVEGVGLGVRRADGDDARAELDADGHVVVRGEAAFAEADREA